jgi:hypothetical protein
MRLWIWILPLLLSSCGSSVTKNELPDAKTSYQVPSTSDQRARPVPRSQKVRIADPYPAAALDLYDAVRRLNAACVAAGGGVSGSPDCDAGTAKEEQLEKLGYCIDYPNHEKLTRCAHLK